MNRWNWEILIALLSAGVVLIGCSSTRVTNPARQRVSNDANVGTEVGNTAPDFRLQKMDGSEISLTDLQGRPAVLIFWTAWCPVCKEEAPVFNALAEKYERRGVQVLGINIQDSIARTQGGIKEFGIRYKVARDADATVARRYSVKGTPTIILLDHKGVVQYFGNQLPADYSARLDALLAGA
jgi:cytochrome c biogenesis protein CcmG, thiol:disulfide interchange protein DsbE